MAGEISVTPESLRAKVDEIFAIDSQLDAASGSASGGRRAILNELVRNADAKSQKFVTQVTGNLSDKFDDESRIAVYAMLTKALEDSFKPAVDTYLDAQVEARKANTPEVDQSQVEELTSKRKDLLTQYNALKNILEMFGQGDAIKDVPEPKSRVGYRGPRKPRAITQFRFKVDDTDLPEGSQLSAAAELIGVKTRELKEEMEADDFDFKNLPAEFSMTVNGHTFSGVRDVTEDEETDAEAEVEAEVA